MWRVWTFTRTASWRACGCMSGGSGEAGVSHLRYDDSDELEALRDWITSWECPVTAGGDGSDRGLLAADLEDPARGATFEMNAQHRQRPLTSRRSRGARPDMNDAMWIAGPGRLRA